MASCWHIDTKHHQSLRVIKHFQACVHLEVGNLHVGKEIINQNHLMSLRDQSL